MKVKKIVSVLLIAAIFVTSLMCGSVTAGAEKKTYSVSGGYIDFGEYTKNGEYTVILKGIPLLETQALLNSRSGKITAFILSFSIEFEKCQIKLRGNNVSNNWDINIVSAADNSVIEKINGVPVMDSADSTVSLYFFIPSKYVGKFTDEASAKVSATLLIKEGESLYLMYPTANAEFETEPTTFTVKPEWDTKKSGESKDNAENPAAPKSVKAKKSASGKAKISWGKVSGANGYEVYMATSKSGKYSKIKTISEASTVSMTKSKLTAGKTYYFKVRAYKTVDGKKVYGKYSSVKSVKV